MTTLTRSNSRANPPVYKDYVNFLAGYKNSKNGEQPENFPSTKAPDVPDFSKKSVPSYNTYLEVSKNQKFCPVKPNLEEPKKTMKSEIFIDIQPTKSVSEVSKVFQNQQEGKIEPKENDFNSRISMFERSTKSKPKVAEKSVLTRYQPQKVTKKTETEVEIPLPPPPPPEPEVKMPEVPIIQPPVETKIFEPKIQGTVLQNPQIKATVVSTNGTIPPEIDRNNPVVKKLVYGALRNMYGAYHDKATDMVSSLPKNMVVKSNGLQDRIDQIAATGALDRLNGRTNPKIEE